MGYTPPMRHFGDFELDEANCELRSDGQRTDIQRKPMDLLIHLIRNRHRVVPKSELFEQVWPGVLVSEAALSSAMRDLRRVLGDSGRRQKTIRTFNGFGFQFVSAVSEVHEFDGSNEGNDDTATVRTAPHEGQQAVTGLVEAVAHISRVADAGIDWSDGLATRLLKFLAVELANASRLDMMREGDDAGIERVQHS